LIFKHFFFKFKVGNKVKIKLVIAEIAKNDKQKKLRKLLSPIITRLDTSQTFGLFHSALIIGPWYLEWNNSSLCVPRKTYSSAGRKDKNFLIISFLNFSNVSSRS